MAMVALAVGASAPVASQPEQRGMGGIIGITVFQDRDFRGRNANFRNDVGDLRESGMNDTIVSFQIAPGETWEVCEHVFYQGRCQIFFGQERDLRQRGWSRIISSMRRVRGGGGGGGWGGGGNERGLVLHSGRNFGGQTRVIIGVANDLRELNFNDMAESLRVPRGEVWEVCDDINFGRCQRVDRDWADLNDIRLRRRISSARPWRQGGGGIARPPIGNVRPSRIVLYSGTDFTGRSTTLDSANSSISRSEVQSVQVFEGGAWQICEDSNFRGRCTSVSGNVNDIRSLGLPGRVRSARPMR
jgi:hypothetical protein